MKNASLCVRAFFVMLVLSGAMACKKILPDKLHFSMPMPEQKFSVPPTPVAGELTLPDANVSMNLDSAISANSGDLYEVSAASVDSFTADITNGHNFDAFKKVSITIAHPDLGSKRLAYLDSIPDGLTHLKFNIENVNMISYLKKSPFQLQVTASTDQKITDTLNMKLNMAIKVELSKK